MPAKPPIQALSGTPLEPSPVTRSRLQGEFIALQEVIQSVGNHIAILDEDVDSFRPLNDPYRDNPFHEQARRAAAKTFLQQSHAANKLYALLASPLAGLPRWFELVGGFPIPDEQIRRGGLELLLMMARKPLNAIEVAQGRCYSVSFTAPVLKRLKSPLWEIGFDINEMAGFLDEQGVDHGLPRTKSSILEQEVVPDVSVESPLLGVVIRRTAKRGRIAALADEIAEAQRRAGDARLNAVVVWSQLVNMVGEAGFPKLRRILDDKTIEYQLYKEGRLLKYSYRNLAPYIDTDKGLKRAYRAGRKMPG